MAPRVGALLLSHPRLGSPGEEFYRKVVLLSSHDVEEGTTGVILNAPTRDRLASLLSAPLAERQQWASSHGPAQLPRGRMFFPAGKRLAASTLAAIRVMRPRIRCRRDGSLLVSFTVPAQMAEATVSAIATAMEQRQRQVLPNALWDDDDNDDGATREAGDEQGGGLEDAGDDPDDLDQRSMVLDPQRDRRDVVWAARPGEHDLESNSDSSSSSSDDDSDDVSDDSDSEDDDDNHLIDSHTLHQLLMDDVVASRHASRRLVVDTCGADLLEACGDAPLRHGGPVTGATVLHACAAAGGTPVLPGVYVGGDTRTLALALRAGYISHSGVAVFAGQASWAPGQLQEELARGEWLLAQGTSAWVLSRPPRRSRAGLTARRGVRTQQGGGGASHEAPARRGLASACLWSRALNAMGGEWAALSLLPRGVDLDGDGAAEAANERPVLTVQP